MNVVVAGRDRAGIADAATERVRSANGDGGGAARENLAATVDPDAADDRPGVEQASAGEGAAADDDAAGADHSFIEDVAAESRVADQLCAGHAAERAGGDGEGHGLPHKTVVQPTGGRLSI